MKFVHPEWLFGSAFALVVAGLLVWGMARRSKALGLFGDSGLVARLQTADPSRRRVLKAVCLVLAVALTFVAAARPQFGRGEKLIPATNLDVMLVLDFSKSMYARDVKPSRIERAKIEVARLTQQLAGARFGAVAFAGEPLGFPLTSDGSAIASFLRQMEPNNMPVGGTAIARALDFAISAMLSDPKAAKHRKVIVLITDGEDLYGHPVELAERAKNKGIQIHVVQVGGRTPERIPEIGPDGRFLRWRQDRYGHPLTTSLSVSGETQLAKIAKLGGGSLVRARKGNTGIEEMTKRLHAMMQQELAEKVETVYEEKYSWPLGAALLLLVLEGFLTEAARRKWLTQPPRSKQKESVGERLRKAQDAKAKRRGEQ